MTTGKHRLTKTVGQHVVDGHYHGYERACVHAPGTPSAGRGEAKGYRSAAMRMLTLQGRFRSAAAETVTRTFGVERAQSVKTKPQAVPSGAKCTRCVISGPTSVLPSAPYGLRGALPSTNGGAYLGYCEYESEPQRIKGLKSATTKDVHRRISFIW